MRLVEVRRLLACLSLSVLVLFASDATADEQTLPSDVAVQISQRLPVQRSCTPRSQCCKVCSEGKACGNSCISRSLTCRKGAACARDSADVCRSKGRYIEHEAHYGQLHALVVPRLSERVDLRLLVGVLLSAYAGHPALSESFRSS